MCPLVFQLPKLLSTTAAFRGSKIPCGMPKAAITFTNATSKVELILYLAMANLSMR